MREAMRRLLVAVFLGLFAAGLGALAALYFIYGFFLWLATQLPGWASVLAPGGLVFLLAIIVLLVLVLMGQWRLPAVANLVASAMGSAAASRFMGSLLGKMSPRTLAVGLGLAAALI